MNNTCPKTLSSHHIWRLVREIEILIVEGKRTGDVHYRQCVACGLIDDTHE